MLSGVGRQRWLFILFAAVAALHLVPIWRVHLVPTVDGPSHVYNAAVLRELAAGSPEFGACSPSIRAPIRTG